MTKQQQDTIAQAIHVLHQLYGGKKWEIEIGDPIYSPDNFTVFRQIIINGVVSSQLDTTQGK